MKLQRPPPEIKIFLPTLSLLSKTITFRPRLLASIAQANPDDKLYPAKVVGPARSSEGAMLYYIIEMY